MIRMYKDVWRVEQKLVCIGIFCHAYLENTSKKWYFKIKKPMYVSVVNEL